MYLYQCYKDDALLKSYLTLRMCDTSQNVWIQQTIFAAVPKQNQLQDLFTLTVSATISTRHSAGTDENVVNV